jgi:hypothetical protein
MSVTSLSGKKVKTRDSFKFRIKKSVLFFGKRPNKTLHICQLKQYLHLSIRNHSEQWDHLLSIDAGVTSKKFRYIFWHFLLVLESFGGCENNPDAIALECLQLDTYWWPETAPRKGIVLVFYQEHACEHLFGFNLKLR